MGYHENEIKNSIEDWCNLIHPNDKDETMSALDEYINRKSKSYKSTFRLKNKAGEYRWILSRGKGVWDENGQPLRLSGSHTDLTDYIQLQESLRAERELSKSIIMDAPSIIIVFDTEEKIIQFNPFAEKTFGFKKEEVIGKSASVALISDLDKNKMSQWFRLMLQENNATELENTVQCKDGSFKSILWNSSVLHDEKGQVAGLVSIGADISERREMEKKLQLVAYYDALTGLPNRACLEKVAKESISRKESFAIINMDIDNFKLINDTMGHAIGDSFIRYVANILKGATETPNTVFRLSGDEFAFLIYMNDNRQELIHWLKEIQLSIKTPWCAEGLKFYITSSMGIAIYPEHGSDVSTLMQNADIAMFHQKEHGKDGYVIFQKAMYKKTLGNVQMSNMLKEAIEKEEFCLYYQPQIDLITGKIIGVEALIRWYHPLKGYIPPAEFIPYAEQMGYIVPISQWVLKEAVQQKKLWERKDYPKIKMAVNLSGYIFTEDTAFESICTLLKDLGVQTDEIEVEVTETAVMMELDKAKDSLERLKHMGMSIAMDDFGTGYSSLNYLQILPFDILKIDRGFIKNITEEKQMNIYKMVVELAHTMGLKVVAEGIETKEQKEFLIKNSCDIGQGHYFSKPISATEIEAIFEKSIFS